MTNLRSTTELISHLHPNLLLLDYHQPSTKAKLTVGSVFFFALVYMVTAALSRLVEPYKRLKTADRIAWNCSGGRVIFGTLCSVIGFWSILWETRLRNDVAHGTTQTTYFLVCVALGFFIFESFTFIWTFLACKTYSVLMLIHHFVPIVSLTVCIYGNEGHFFVASTGILEMNIPLSCLTWTLSKCDQKKSLFWKGSQLLLIHIFHCRNIVECYIFYVMYKTWTYMWSTMSSIALVSLLAVLVPVTVLMTPFWTYQLTAIYNRQIVKEKNIQKEN